jgi:hypothetical protein
MCWCKRETFTEEDFILIILTICTALRSGGWYVPCREIYPQFWYKNIKERDHLQANINVLQISSCRSIMGLLQLSSWNLRFHRMLGLSSLAEDFWRMTLIPVFGWLDKQKKNKYLAKETVVYNSEVKYDYLVQFLHYIIHKLYIFRPNKLLPSPHTKTCLLLIPS